MRVEINNTASPIKNKIDNNKVDDVCFLVSNFIYREKEFKHGCNMKSVKKLEAIERHAVTGPRRNEGICSSRTWCIHLIVKQPTVPVVSRIGLT